MSEVMEDDDHEWELSKENVQPLRQGRHMPSLALALHSTPNEQVIKENQRAFEEELRAYTGDDPFDVWDRYIKWTEQYFPKGGHEGHLPQLIEQCLQKFQTEPNYINDLRFIRLWIKFANLSDRSIEVFSYMFDKGIGHKVACFYVEWALSLEMDGNTKQADTIYTEGLNRLAEPRDLLLQKRQEFEYRLARNIIIQRTNGESEMETGETEEARTALCRLKGSGARHKVGTTRTGAVKLGSAGLFKNATSKASAGQQVPSKGLSIFVDDENNPNGSRPQMTQEWTSVPRRAVDNRENDKKPGIWTDARIRQQQKPVAPPGLAYQIHEDAESVLATPQKTAFINKQPLSTCKDRQSDVLSGIRNAPVVQPGEGIPQYQKHNVYNGVTEFSLEELRAVKYWKRRKEKELEAERQAERLRVEEVRKKREEAMSTQLKEQSERLAMIENLLQSHMKGLSIQTLQNAIQQPAHGQQEQLTQQTLSQNQNLRMAMPADVQTASSQDQISQRLPSSAHTISSCKKESISRSDTSVKQEIFSQRMEAAAESNASSDFITPTNQSGYSINPPSSASTISSSGGSQLTPIFNSSSTYLSKSGSGASGSSNSSLIKSFRTKDHASMNESSASVHNNSSLSGDLGKHSFAHSTTPGSNDSSISHKPLLGLPSPTVCTKEAMQVVQGMFCTDLEQDNLVNGSIHNHERSLLPEKPAPFKICEDNAPVDKRPSFQVHCDDGSAVPNSVKKEKARSFGLQKSFLPTDDGSNITIEGQARDDLTLAPLDNFSLQARAASTPFSSSHIKSFEPTQELQSEDSLNSCSSSAVTYDRVLPASNNLSPITEGSEGSGSSLENHSTKCHSQVSELGLSSKGTRALPLGSSVKEEVEEAEGDVSMHDDELLDATHQHLIDTSACVAVHDERTQDLLSASAYKAPQNPFDEKLNANFLKRLNPPLSSYSNFHHVPSHLPEMGDYAFVQLDDTKNEFVTIEKCLGEGGYAKVFLISKCSLEDEDNQFLAMKVQKPPCHWEFYIACEMQKRLMALNAPMDVTPALADIKDGYFYEDGSLLLMKYMEYGSLLNLVNKYKVDRQLMADVEPFACLLTIEILHLMEQLHKCNFIHGDVKPDNFLFRDLPNLAVSQDQREVFGSHLRLFCLTDFGQSIDLAMFPPGTTFQARVTTSSFQCIEMRTDRLWTFQTDLFGVAGTIHVALFGSYMKVFMERGTWKTTSNFVRKWNVPLWKKLFHELLNVPSCDLMPNLTALRLEFERYMMASLIQPYNTWVQTVRGKLICEAALDNTV